MRHLVDFTGGASGEYVRFNGHRHKVVAVKPNGTRIYFNEKTGETFPLARAEQIYHAFDTTLTTDRSWDDVVAPYQEVLEIDWGPGGFTDEEIASAYTKLAFMNQLDARNDDGTLKYHAKQRRTKEVIRIAIKAARELDPDLPSPAIESIRRWDLKWIASGRDIRVLADRHQDKGHRGSNEEFAWIDVIINDQITKYATQHPYYDVAQLDTVIKPLVQAKAAAEGLPLHPRLREQAYYGLHRIRTLLNRRTLQEQYLQSKGRREARRASKGNAAGPSGDYPLHHVEADHHLMDITIVSPVDPKVVLGRPWLTVLFDRYSRMILGFHISMEAPNHFSVARALSMSVQPKGQYLASLGYKFTFDWLCKGSPDFLFVDRAPEFHGEYLKALVSLLNIVPVDVPRARGDLKGKVERWFGIVAGSAISRLPGYLGSSPKKRIHETAVPKLTLAQLEVVVAAFVVDHYNVHQHSETGEWPSKRFSESQRSNLNEKLAPPAGILGLTDTPPVLVALDKDGFRIDGSRYYSDEVQSRWFNDGIRQVVVQPNSRDAREVRVHLQGPKWATAYLQGRHAHLPLSPSELKDLVKGKKRPKETPEEHLMQLQADRHLTDYIDALAPRSEAPKRRPRQASKPVNHLVKPVIDRELSAAPLQGYDPAQPVLGKRYDSGEFGGPSISEQVMTGTLDENRYQPPPPAPKPAAAPAPASVPSTPPATPQPSSVQPLHFNDDEETIRL